MHDRQQLRNRFREVAERIRNQRTDIPPGIQESIKHLEHRLATDDPPEPTVPRLWGLYGVSSLEHDFHNLANDVYKLEWFDESIELYGLALMINPELLETYFNRGLAYTRVNKYDEAIVDLDKVIQLNPHLAEAWYTRGLIYEYKQDYDKAIEQYDKALEIDENYEKAETQRTIARNKKEQLARGGSDSEDDRQDRLRRERREQADAVVGALEACAQQVKTADEPAVAWRKSPERQQLMDYLSQYGRVLTGSQPQAKSLVGAEEIIRSLVRTLCKRKRRSGIVVGPPGTGKTAAIHELAHRIVHGHPTIPARLRDVDIFELSPVFLHADTKYRGEYEEKVRDLIRVIEKSPRVILFVDEVHSFFQSGMHDTDDSYSRTNQAFKKVLAEGTVTCVGCTTPVEYRHYIEPDPALARRFSIIRLDPPTQQTTFEILRARRHKLEQHYSPVKVPEEMLKKAVEFTEDRLPSRFQPDKSIQLLDEACAYCVTEPEPIAELTEDVLLRALEDMVGRSVVRTQELTETGVYERLRDRIIGHDEVLRELARATLAGLGGWLRRSGPRGVFLFGGPTGVGKTEAALTLAEIVGGGRDALVRVDCNTIQGSGLDSSSAVHRLLGVPPGLVGYARGQGGLLSRIRDLPESIVLFDEFEKADPGVGHLLLQIIDDGRVEDADGNKLDFRRSFMIFTTNAGAVYEPENEMSFLSPDPDAFQPAIDEEGLRAALRYRRIGEEFFGRLTHVFLFQSLERDELREIVVRKLEELQDIAELRGLRLHWEDTVIDHLTHQWQPRYGVRHLSTILRNRIVEHLNLADAQGELRDVGEIRLEVDEPESKAGGAGPHAPARRNLGTTSRVRRDGRLLILLQ
jgi:ATP-dependent Clp protease ATP-binding subunit ClpA